ncbi:unnamed protein product [Tenebrio molitor]|nr:unnamed protein product [Tenebrio molitor]
MYQANSMKNTICKVLLNTRNKENRQELHAYGLQMFHENLQITAGGFFVVDSTLLFSMISSSSTYVVIILQFLYFERQYNKNIELW